MFLKLILVFFIFAAEDKKDNINKSQLDKQKVSWVAHVLRQKDQKTINEVEITETRLPVILVPEKGDLRPLVELKLKLNTDNISLFTPGKRKVKRSKDGQYFVIHAFLNSQVSELTLISEDRDGNTQEEIIYIFAPEAQEFEVIAPWNSLSAYIGLANLAYSQSLFGTLSWRSAAIGLGYSSQEGLSPWGLNAHIDMTALTFDSQPIAANPQLINGRFNISYRIPFREKTRWRYYTHLGVGYLSLVSNGSPFGFTGIYYPDIALRAKNFINTHNLFQYEVRLNPLDNMTFSRQRGIQLSWAWSRTLKSSRRQDLIIKYGHTHFTSSSQNLETEFLMLSLGYSI
jgi:hypothetical protein